MVKSSVITTWYSTVTWKTLSKSVKHSGDNRTGAGDGDDETITIDTTKVSC